MGGSLTVLKLTRTRCGSRQDIGPRSIIFGPPGLSSPTAEVWLVGHGNRTGYASTTLIGVGRSARATIQEIRSVVLPVESGSHQLSIAPFREEGARSKARSALIATR